MSTDGKDGPCVVDRRTGQPFTEVVLGDALLRRAYTGPLRRVSRWALFRHGLATRLLGWYADSCLSRGRIPGTIAQLGIDMGECRDPVGSFPSFNAFFCRHLRPEARPFDRDPTRLLSPADCRLLVFPTVDAGDAVQVKGYPFTVSELLGPGRDAVAARFAGGAVAICRLCPADYHRYHFPAAGVQSAHWRVPGRFDSVNPFALACGVRVFAGNVREVSLLDLECFGPCAYVAVGAFGVARLVQTHAGGPFARLDEKGYFAFGGSTLVLVFADGAVCFDHDLATTSARGLETLVRCGETIGRRA